MLEAMALGCLVVGSDTPPVKEVIEDGVNGCLAPFADSAIIAGRIIEALAEPARFKAQRKAARQTIIDRYDLRRVVLPAQRMLIERHLPGALDGPARDVRMDRRVREILAGMPASS
jgi:glycosyltransferase involved in cell wall biosynthesis